MGEKAGATSNPLWSKHYVEKWDAHAGEIDIVGLSESDNAIVFGACKFKTQPLGTDVLAALEEKSRKVTWGGPNRTEFFVLFSIGGFSDALQAAAKQRSDVFLQK